MTRYDSSSDEALIEAIQRGDGDAAACLYYRHIDRVHRICHRIVLDSSQAPDCVQEVWMKVFRTLGRFRCERSFVAWLNAVAANTAIDYYRRTTRQGHPADIEEIGPEALVAEEEPEDPPLDGAMLRRRVREALEEVSVNQRTALVLRYFEEMPVPEIARVLQCREGTVRTHIRRCLLTLRAKLATRLNQEVQEYGR
jgi:RNA polymerase sigma-70 factor (ECF subfamily)